MILIDGVKYEEWEPEGDRAEEELEQIVKEHASEIFGENSIYFDIKHKLKSKAGTGTIPDGYVLTFGNNPQLHIVEVELFNHSYDHIISQITKIITCLKDSSTWNDIARTIRDEINKDELTATKAKKAMQPGEVYEFLYDRISNLASLVIVIDKDRMDVREGIGNITHRDIKMMEFRTFKRVGADAVHAHIFEPLYEIARENKQKLIISDEHDKKPSNKVAAGDFTHIGNGIFTLKSNSSVVINARKHQKLIKEQLNKQGLWTQSLGNFHYDLRKKAGLLNTPAED